MCRRSRNSAIPSCSTARSASPARKAWTRRSSQILHDAFKKALEDPAVIATLEQATTWCRATSSTADYNKAVKDVIAQENAALEQDRPGSRRNERRARDIRHDAIPASCRIAQYGERPLKVSLLRNARILGRALLARLRCVHCLITGYELGLGKLHEPGSGFAIFWLGLFMRRARAVDHLSAPSQDGRDDIAVAVAGHALGQGRSSSSCCCWSSAVLFELDRLHSAAR